MFRIIMGIRVYESVVWVKGESILFLVFKWLYILRIRGSIDIIKIGYFGFFCKW